MRNLAAILLITLSTFSVTSIAAPQSRSNEDTKGGKVEQCEPAISHANEKNAVAFCYFDDKAYSEGAVVGGKVCIRHESMDAFGSKSETLHWVKASSTTAGAQ
jgi:hypothetical protein